jgi:hypothetical protein
VQEVLAMERATENSGLHWLALTDAGARTDTVKETGGALWGNPTGF